MLRQSGSGWHCDSCNHDTENPTYRYIMSVNISDHTGSQWVTMFDEAATQLVGKSATALDAMYKRVRAWDLVPSRYAFVHPTNLATGW